MIGGACMHWCTMPVRLWAKPAHRQNRYGGGAPRKFQSLVHCGQSVAGISGRRKLGNSACEASSCMRVPGTPTYKPPNDPLVALTILNTRMWGFVKKNFLPPGRSGSSSHGWGAG